MHDHSNLKQPSSKSCGPFLPNASYLELLWERAGCRQRTEFKDAAAVKNHLCELHGFPMYLQTLVHGCRRLSDDTKLDGAMDLQLVLVTLSSLPQHLGAVAARDLEDAAQQNRVATVRCLVDAEHGYFEVARLLLEAGAGKDFTDQDGRTALILASKFRAGNSEVARLLLEAGAERDSADQYGRTALIFASYAGHSGVARLLLEARARTDCRDVGGLTALMYASPEGHENVNDHKPHPTGGRGEGTRHVTMTLLLTSGSNHTILL